MKFLHAASISALLAVSLPKAEAQAATGSILHVELVNATLYFRGYCGPSDRGQNPNKLPGPAASALRTGIGFGDIISVNGEPVKGTAVENISGSVSPSFTPGVPIGDFAENPASSWDLGFLNTDGTKIGSIHIEGSGGGTPPPGAPKEITAATWTVTGGTGAFFGARGYFIAPQDSVSGVRQTTDCEDPAYRRINADPGANKRHAVLYLVPLVQPQILASGNTPAVVHADRSLVTTANPAKAGETLTLFATGLGPTRPGVDPGQSFTRDPLQVVNSPVQVLVNGNPGDVLYAAGFPGTVDQYWVDFRVPSGTAAGQTSIQVTSAWMGGPAVQIPIQ